MASQRTCDRYLGVCLRTSCFWGWESQMRFGLGEFGGGEQSCRESEQARARSWRTSGPKITSQRQIRSWSRLSRVGGRQTQKRHKHQFPFFVTCPAFRNSTQFQPNFDPNSTQFRPKFDPTSTPNRPNFAQFRPQKAFGSKIGQIGSKLGQNWVKIRLFWGSHLDPPKIATFWPVSARV